MKRRMTRRSWSPTLWGQLKIMITMLTLSVVFDFAICVDMMVKKPIQSNIYEEPLTPKIGCLGFNIKAVMIEIEMNDLERCAAFC